MEYKYPINWFEIPVNNMRRAVKFYETILDISLPTHSIGEKEMAFFSTEPLEVSGVLVKSPKHSPSEQGSLLYLNAGRDLSKALNKVEPAGGKILEPKTLIAQGAGYQAFFIDSEGNKLALHSPE